MKILFVTHGSDMMGANRSMLNLIKGLQKYQVTAVILTPNKGKLILSVPSDQEVIVHPYYRWADTQYISKGYWLNTFLQKKNQNYLKKIAEEIKLHQFDLIYSNSSTIGIGAQLADHLSIPHVWRIREFGEEDYGLSFWKGRKYFFEWANKSAAISFISQSIQDKFNRYIDVPTYCIYNGVISKQELTQITPCYDQHKETFTFLIIGLIHPGKGQLEAVKALQVIHKDFPKAKLLIVGKGRRLYTKKIRKYIHCNNLSDSVKLLGYIDNPHEVYKKADCLLMCSKSEGMGRVTIEAMIHGKAIIGYNGGATPELVQHGKNGLIYNTQKELSQHMASLLNNKSLVEQYGIAGRKVAEKFVVEISVEKEYHVFREVLSL